MFSKYLALIIFISLVASVIINYSTNLFSGIEFDEREEWTLVFEQQTEAGMPIKAPQFAKNYLGWENFSKKDLLFVAWYEIKLNLGEDISGKIPGLKISLSLPGDVIEHNATRIENGNVIWESIPEGGELVLKTRLIRWWLIVLFLVLSFLRILFAKRKKALIIRK